MRLHTLVAILAIAFFGLQVGSKAADNLAFPAFSGGPVGAVIRIPVSGTISVSGIVEVGFEYTPSMMRVLGVYGGPFLGFKCIGKFNPVLDSASGNTGFYRVECGNVESTNNGLLFEVEVQLLNGPDTTGTITVSSLTSDGIVSADAEFTVGVVNVEGGNTARPITWAGIGMVFPNPVSSVIGVNFIVNEAGPVKFDLFSAGGRLAYELGTVQSNAGENTIQFSPKAWEISQGALLLRMKTATNDYFYPIMVVK